jgi:hypothetical protein
MYLYVLSRLFRGWYVCLIFTTSWSRFMICEDLFYDAFGISDYVIASDVRMFHERLNKKRFGGINIKS